MVNREYLVEQLLLLEEYVQRSRELAGESRESFLANILFVDATIRRLTVLFETAHNIAKHIIAESAWEAPASKAHSFEILAQRGFIPMELRDAFREAARFRNLATYQTTRLDNGVVYDILIGHLTDFEAFARYVARALDSSAL
jgi:uncharacterized protein YutE (UPF0331/DUF86 family)